MRLGVLDWGIGGLFAVRRIQARLGADIVYLSDTGNTPYGLQSRPALTQSVSSAIGVLRDAGAEHILVACHSASTVIPWLDIAVPVQGVIAPEALPAQGRVLVLGGRRTVRSMAWRKALEGRFVRQRIAQPLSALIEAGQAAHPECQGVLSGILRPVLDAEVVVLACTHYRALHGAIAQAMPHACIVDPAMFVADNLVLEPRPPALKLLTTGDVHQMARSAAEAVGIVGVPVRVRA